MRGALFALALLVASSAHAQAVEVDRSVWRESSGSDPKPVNVDIAVPRRAATLTLIQLRSFSPGGFDVGGEYRTDDRALIGTLYIYRPASANAANAVIATDSVIKGIRGAGVVSLSHTLVPMAGVVNAAHRLVYDHLQSGPSALGDALAPDLASVFMVAQVGDWLVKVRVSGPSARRAEVEAAADALIAGVKPGRGLAAIPAAIDTVTECPESDPEGEVRAQAKVATPADRMAAGITVILGIGGPTAKDPPKSRALCVMRRDTQRGIALVLRENAGPRTPSLVLFGDSGGTLEVVPLGDKGKTGAAIVFGNQGKAASFGPFDRAPSARQLIGIFGGDGVWLGQPAATATRDAKGNPKIEVALPAAPSS